MLPGTVMLDEPSRPTDAVSDHTQVEVMVNIALVGRNITLYKWPSLLVSPFCRLLHRKLADFLQLPLLIILPNATQITSKQQCCLQRYPSGCRKWIPMHQEIRSRVITCYYYIIFFIIFLIQFKNYKFDPFSTFWYWWCEAAFQCHNQLTPTEKFLLKNSYGTSSRIYWNLMIGKNSASNIIRSYCNTTICHWMLNIGIPCVIASIRSTWILEFGYEPEWMPIRTIATVVNTYSKILQCLAYLRLSSGTVAQSTNKNLS